MESADPEVRGVTRRVVRFWYLGFFVICRSEGVRAPGTAYVIPARVGVWLVGAASWGRMCDSSLSLPLLPLALGVGVFRGAFPGTGTTRMRSPDRDLQNVP